ncbi:MAG: hypothetical protein WDN69_04080 [Aliidongia sp.]
MTPELCSLTRTSPGAGSGVGSVPTVNTSPAGPFFEYQAARIIVFLGSVQGAREMGRRSAVGNGVET